MARIISDQAPSAKPVSISIIVTDQWQTIVDTPDYDVPVVGFGTSRRVAPGVSEISSPLVIANIGETSDNISVRIVRSERFITNSQTQESYDNATANGTFSGGVGYVDGESITLLSNTTVTVVSNTNGTVSQFIISSEGNRVFRDGNGESVLPQVISNGNGSGFTLIARESNYNSTDGIFSLAKDYPIEIRDTMIIPLNGQFILTGDRLQIKATNNDKLIATISFTEGQAEEDDVFLGV